MLILGTGGVAIFGLQLAKAMGSALAAIISPVVGGFLIDYFGNWDLPFVGSILLMGIGVVLAFRMQPESRFEAGATDKPQVSTRMGV